MAISNQKLERKAKTVTHNVMRARRLQKKEMTVTNKGNPYIYTKSCRVESFA